MAALDKGKILQYETEIKEAMNALADITSRDMAECIQDSLKIKAMKYTLIILVEAICNLCRHILAKKVLIAVEEYAETIIRMQEKGFLSEEVVNQLVPLIKLRHQLIHGYWKTDDQRLFLETKNSLSIIDKFLSEVNRLVIESGPI